MHQMGIYVLFCSLLGNTDVSASAQCCICCVTEPRNAVTGGSSPGSVGQELGTSTAGAGGWGPGSRAHFPGDSSAGLQASVSPGVAPAPSQEGVPASPEASSASGH